MRSITMTSEQTETYDGGSDEEQIALMAALRRQAQALADDTGETVEIYTAEGVVADAVYPQ